MNDEYQKIFDSLKRGKDINMHVNSKVLIVDSLNTFLRSFAVIQHVNQNLNHIGGLTGFLRSLGSVINLVKPTRVILVFDGQGSSVNKRYIYPEYKANRGITRITNWDMFEDQKQESEAITNQIVRLIDYLKCLPVDMISIDKIEADDTIGFLSKQLSDEVVIMSSDRDFLQLVNSKLTVYSPTKKKYYDEHLVRKEYFVSVNNFLLQKTIIGDKGDNIPGVKGIQGKTLIKLFPELAEPRTILLEELLQKCQKEEKGKYKDILHFEQQLKINRQLMDLHDPNISLENKDYILSVIENPNKTLKTLEFVNLYNEDGLGDSIKNVNSWLFDKFHSLSKFR